MSEINFNLVRGTEWKRTVYVTDSNGDAVDITGWTIFLTLKTTAQMDDANDDNATLQKEWTTFDDAENGSTVVKITSAEAADLLGRYRFDLMFKDDSGEFADPVIGFMNYKNNVTKRTS